MRVRPLTLTEAEERAPSIARRHFLLGGLALAISPETVGPAVRPQVQAVTADIFSVTDLARAVEMLRRANVPPHVDGSYSAFLHPDAATEIRLDQLLVGATYRVAITACSLLAHERERERRGKRGHVDASEIFERALALG